MDLTPFIAIIISLILVAFFAGIEIAFISANKLSLELNKKQGTYSGKIWGNFADHPTKFIGTVLVGANIVLVVFVLLINYLLTFVWHRFSFESLNSIYIKLLVETLIATVVIIFIEFVSKALFRSRNNSILSNGIIAYIVQFFFSIFFSVSSLFVNIAEWVLKYVFNVKINDRKEVFSKVDLEHYVQQNKMHNEEDSSEINKELFDNALSLGDVRLRECLVPRKEIVSIEQGGTIADVKKIFTDTRLSKLVVYNKNIDTITGYIHQLDLFKNPATIAEILLPIPTVPESMSATDLMNKFSKERKSIAWVIDEFGGTAGIVTMEDLLEEIFGEIKDEYDDVEDLVDKQIASNEYIFSGRVELDYISEKYDISFSEDETAETLSGYIIQHNEGIPQEKEQIIIGNYEFSIISMSDTRIETVKLKVLR
jgi:CBS domain containing-hemolysin-like protein